MPPLHILNAPTALMRGLGYGRGYQYDHATEAGFSGQNYFPEGTARRKFYRPGGRGFEREIRRRLDYWEKLRARAAVSPS
jgi:putative ATPase